jgi:hypothetical protein
MILSHWTINSLVSLAIGTLLLGAPATCHAGDVWVNFGGGPQPGADQDNESAGFDIHIATFTSTPRKALSIGASYTWLGTNTDTNRSMYAISVFPQLTFWPTEGSRIRGWVPSGTEPFFFVRALGPSYISENTLGERQQANNFAFQAQIGAGLEFGGEDGRRFVAAISWKHFSNANLFSDNDGIDLPLMLNFGVRF